MLPHEHGKPRGAAVLLQPDVGTAVLDLVFARIPAGRVNDLAVLTPHSNPRKIMVDVFTNQTRRRWRNSESRI